MNQVYKYKKGTVWAAFALLFACASSLMLFVAKPAKAAETVMPRYDDATNTLYVPAGTVEAADLRQMASETHADTLEHVVFEGDVEVIFTEEDDENGSFFNSCKALSSVEVYGKVSFSGFRPSLNDCFSNCTSLKELDLSLFDTKNIVDMLDMFTYCSALQTVDLSSFNTSKVEAFSHMFGMCSSLEEIDLSSFSSESLISSDTKVGDPCLEGMFAYCNNLKKVNLGHISTSKLTIKDMKIMFATNGDMQSDDKLIPIPNLSQITMDSSCILYPGEIIDGMPEGTYFDYDHPAGWNAYYNQEFVKTLHSFDEFVEYQNSHSGQSVYAWADGDQPVFPDESISDGWHQNDTGWRYGKNNTYVTGWLWVDDQYGAHWYFFDEDTYMATSRWIWDDAWEGWYWVCSTGPMIENLWQWIDNAWYGFWWGGKMCQGWVWDTAYVAWYYCDDYTGRVACNEWAWDGAWYYFNQNCQMLSNCWVGEYWLNEHGMWV